ncbi:ATP-binding cassette domain-containing protein [Lacinutrix jangbogonensis]|uniref:ATP-binding cassette domain-containing protein n=1 Tax=Lacinutrix jangbogonensis TaxID=1469557 RepID=UPI00053DEE42|nr:ATP-binding cassette domain-containing protein [Lacinutrix jangbogonensis]
MSRLFVDSVTKSYNNRVILSDVFLSCEIGEVKGLIGRNGSGKSTLLKIIFGVEKAESKFVKVERNLIRSTTDCKGLISYLPQNHFLPNGIKIIKIINLFLEKKYRKKLLTNEFVLPLLDKTSQELSGGQRRIIEILLLIHSKAKFILLDEPFNGVGPILKDYIAECILEVKEHKGVIITDHDYENVLKLSDNITFLKEGYLREIKDRSQLLELGYFVRMD